MNEEMRSVDAEMLAQAVAAHAVGDLPAAERAYHAAASAGNAEAALQLGLIRQGRGDYAGAEVAYRQAASAGDPEATLNLANLYADYLDRPDDARQLYEASITADDVRGMIDFGFFLWERGDFPGAEAAFRRAADAGERRAYLELGFLFADQNRDEDALAAFELAVAAGVKAAQLHVGWQLARLGRPHEAEEALRRAYTAGDAPAGVLLRAVLKDVGREDAGESVGDPGASASQSVSLTYRQLLAQLDGDDLHTDELERWVRDELAPETPTELGALLFDAARLAAAETRLLLAVKYGDEDAFKTLSNLYLALGRADEADALRHIVEADRSPPA